MLGMHDEQQKEDARDSVVQKLLAQDEVQEMNEDFELQE